MTQTDDSRSSDWYSAETSTFGDRVAGAREALGLTQDDVASRLGIKLETLAGWEDDLNDPRANKLQVLAGVLNVSIKWLLTGEGEGPAVPAALDADAAQALDDIRALSHEIADMSARLQALEARLRAGLAA